MKKLISLALIFVLMLSIVPVEAKIGDVIGTALNTDIVAYINDWAIPSYAVNGQSVVVAEDLRNFGFAVKWNASERSLDISVGALVNAKEMEFAKSMKTGTKFANILETDIKVYANGKQLTSYAMNGYTMIPMEELECFGKCEWLPEKRTLKLWVTHLNNRGSEQQIPKSVVGAPCGYGWMTGNAGMGFSVNSADKITLYWEAKNYSNKVINYYTLYFSMYNPVGDPAYDEIKGTSKTSVRTVGPIAPGTNFLCYTKVGYSAVCHKVVIDSIYIEYADGTTEWVDYGFGGYETFED